MQRDELSVWQRGVMAAHRLFPEVMRGWKLPLPSGTTVVTAVAAAERADCTVSIIVPVYNEGATVRELLDSLLALRLTGVNKQVIIVESNSHRRQQADRGVLCRARRRENHSSAGSARKRVSPSAKDWPPPPATS